MSPSKTTTAAAFAAVGWVFLLGGTAQVYATIISSKLNIGEALNLSNLVNPKIIKQTVGSGQYQTTVSEFDPSQAKGFQATSFAWVYNDTDVLVEGYAWWIVAFQLFGTIYAVLSPRKLAALCMHVVLTGSTFIYTRTVLSGYLFCLQTTLSERFTKPAGWLKSPILDAFDGVKTGLAAAFAGCIVVDVANVMIIHALADELQGERNTPAVTAAPARRASSRARRTSSRSNNPHGRQTEMV